MDFVLQDSRKKLAERLFEASDDAKKNRLSRLINHPWRTVFPIIIRSIHSRRELSASTFWGGSMSVILPEPVSMHIWRYGFFEADVCLYLIDYLKEGMTFVDVGGHFGFFTLLGSFLAGKEGGVLTFEPTPSTFAQLEKNISANSGFPNVKAINCAAYSSNNGIRFYDYGLEASAFNSAFESKAPYGSHDKGKELFVPSKKIDDVLREKGIISVDLVKIDAESTELDVLIGMTKTIDAHKPIIIIEVGDSHSKEVPTSREIVSWLTTRGYETFEFRESEIVPHTHTKTYGYGNLLFRPKSG